MHGESGAEIKLLAKFAGVWWAQICKMVNPLPMKLKKLKQQQLQQEII
jgi:hypothetical protein